MGKLGGIVVALLIAGGVIYLKFHNKDAASAEYREMMSEVLVQCCQTPAEADYLAGLVAVHHERVFESAYDLGGRRSSASIDEQQYAEELYTAIEAHLQRDGERELLSRVREQHREIMAYIEAETAG